MGCQRSKNTNLENKSKLKINNTTSKTRFKAVLLGNASVGKSSIASRYITGKIDPDYGPTVGGVFYKKQYLIESGLKLTLNLWDTAGQQKYRAMAPLYYRDADVCVVVFDVSDKDSFKAIDYWIEELDHKIKKDKMKLFIVGNKADSKKRIIKKQQIQQMLRNHKQVEYLQTSAYTGIGVNQLFEKIFKSYINF